MATVDTNEQREEDRTRNWKSARKKKPLANLTDWKSIEDDREKYAAYLCSREWSVLKEQVKKRSNGQCERCGRFDGDAVHHLTYERKYNECLNDLQHTCKHCHSFIHGKSQHDPLDSCTLAIQFLRRCKEYGNKPIPFEILVGIYGIDDLRASEFIRAAIVLNAAGLRNPAIVLCEQLPFSVPWWFIDKTRISNPHPTYIAYKLMGFPTDWGDESWWRDGSEEP